MKILMISLDSSIIDEKKAFGDFKKRLIEYSRYYSEVYLFIPWRKRIIPKKLNKTVTIYPLNRNPLLFLFQGIIQAKKINKDKGIDLITCQDPLITGLLGVFLKNLLKIPIIIQLHGDFLDNPYWLSESKLNVLFNQLGKFVMKRANGIRVVSKKIEKYINKSFKIPNSNVFRIPIPVDLSLFQKTPHSDKKNDTTIILHVGRLSREKNIPLLLKASQLLIKESEDIQIIIIGDGPERKNLEKLVSKIGISDNVQFLGRKSHDLLVNYYKTSDFVVITSNREGWNLVAIEALASGTPVIMKDIGCAGEIVLDGISGLIYSGSEKDLADKIKFLIENPDKGKKMGEAGKKLVSELPNIKKSTKLTVNFYRNLLSS